MVVVPVCNSLDVFARVLNAAPYRIGVPTELKEAL
jgi:hypothetical protein